MTSNTTIQTSKDIEMTEKVPMQQQEQHRIQLTEQKVSIAKNGKKRIQPVMMSVPHNPPQLTTNVAAPSFSSPIAHRDNGMEYDDPVLPVQGVGSTVSGNKRKLQEDEIVGNQTKSRVTPEWITSTVTPPIVQKSQVRMGVPKVKSVLTAKLRREDPTVVMECHNAPNHSKFSFFFL